MQYAVIGLLLCIQLFRHSVDARHAKRHRFVKEWDIPRSKDEKISQTHRFVNENDENKYKGKTLL